MRNVCHAYHATCFIPWYVIYKMLSWVIRILRIGFIQQNESYWNDSLFGSDEMERIIATVLL